jgi:GT2 family glycosyltransferase
MGRIPQQVQPVKGPRLDSIGPVKRSQTPTTLSVIIVNYHDWEATERLVHSLFQCSDLSYGRVEVILVNNGLFPEPASNRIVATPGLNIINRSENEGFARAVNYGAQIAKGDWFLLLNPDVEIGAKFLESVLDLLNQIGRRIGIVGLHLKSSDGASQPSAGCVPTLMSTLTGLFRDRERRKCSLPIGPFARQVPWVTGCGLLVRRTCFEELGGLDSDFFLYYEDVDFAHRARKAGWKVIWHPQVALVHRHPMHQRAVPPRLRLLTRHALLTFARKHWSRGATLLLTLVVWLEALARRWRHRHDATAWSVYRHLGTLAWHCVCGRYDAAYQTVWQLAQGSEYDVRINAR